MERVFDAAASHECTEHLRTSHHSKKLLPSLDARGSPFPNSLLGEVDDVMRVDIQEEYIVERLDWGEIIKV